MRCQNSRSSTPGKGARSFWLWCLKMALIFRRSSSSDGGARRSALPIRHARQAARESPPAGGGGWGVVRVRGGEGGGGQEAQTPAAPLVEDRDVARGLVGDPHLVRIVVQLAEDAARRDDVVVRVRREDDDALALGQLAPP